MKESVWTPFIHLLNRNDRFIVNQVHTHLNGKNWFIVNQVHIYLPNQNNKFIVRYTLIHLLNKTDWVTFIQKVEQQHNIKLGYLLKVAALFYYCFWNHGQDIYCFTSNYKHKFSWCIHIYSLHLSIQAEILYSIITS